MSSLFPPMSKSIQSPSFPNNSLNFHQSMGQSSQPNSPADSAIGTASESIQSPPLDANAQRQKSTQISAQFSQPSTSESQQPPRPPKKLSTRPKNGQISISLPIREKIVCQRDFERIVKETEILRGTKGTSQEQLMAESKLSREWLNEPDKNINNNNDRVEESRKYYYFDPIRHEYRLYYSREVRLRSETNLSAIGLDIELRGMKANQNEEKTTMSPLRRRHSAGAGHLRSAVPPPKNAFSNGNGGNGLGQLAQQNATRFTAVENNELKMEGTNGNVGGFGGERQINAENEPKTMRRGAFERNSTSRKPFQLRSVSDPPRRRQWSGGAKRAALLKQQQQELLEQQKRMGTELGIGQNRPIPAIRQNQIVPKTNEKGEKERIGNENWQKSLNGIGGMNSINSPPTVTNQMLKQLLRPLHKNEDFGWHSDDQNIKKWATGGGDYDKEALLGSPSPSQQKQQMMAIDTDNSMDRKKGKKGRRSIWNCFRMKGKAKNEEDGKNRRKTLPESGRPPNARLQRYMAFLLVPLFLLVAAAAIAIVVIIWYI